ncbi:Heavy metal transport/detoxification superfamily protein [Raphanus sativus]|uniref:Heavy metal-associated isoprenylated plant protein 44 n=1 Tax=Raphanus sativus TaxID=3726 RepID=A0A6J0L0C9_RAPSA|nr:heavy metal-associated isoprenylated plant protein 44 [Raphanus sativus]KAJ4876183.1 Heavy metal transport/detoxification superfamily protein [Raphanus sativus]
MSTFIAKSLGSLVSIVARFFSFRRRPKSNPRPTTHISYFRMSKKRPLSLQTVDLKVRMCCTGCVRIVRKAISKLRGVDSVEVEREMGRVRVVGYVDRNKVLKAVRRAGKRAEFWPYPEPPLYFTSTQNYFVDPSKEFKESYNYYRHGYNGTEQHGNIPVGSRGDDRVSNMFNDDNVNACRVM